MYVATTAASDASHASDTSVSEPRTPGGLAGGLADAGDLVAGVDFVAGAAGDAGGDVAGGVAGDVGGGVPGGVDCATASVTSATAASIANAAVVPRRGRRIVPPARSRLPLAC